MSKTRSLLILIALLSFPTTGSGSIVIDDFGTSATTLVETGEVSRSLFGGASLSPGEVTFASQKLSLLIYTVQDAGSTFGDLDAGFVNGVSFSSSALSPGSDFEIALYADGVFAEWNSFVDGGMAFNVDVTAASELIFMTLGCTQSGHQASLGGSFSAVPEPTSLILVGIACSGIVFRRRRVINPLEA